MPLYEYECQECGARFEIIQKFSDEPLALHSDYDGVSCSGSVRKLLAAPAIQFKGSGWYVTDYGKGGKKPDQERDRSKASKKDAKSSDKSKSKGKDAKASTKAGRKSSRAAASS